MEFVYVVCPVFLVDIKGVYHLGQIYEPNIVSTVGTGYLVVSTPLYESPILVCLFTYFFFGGCDLIAAHLINLMHCGIMQMSVQIVVVVVVVCYRCECINNCTIDSLISCSVIKLQIAA